MKARIRITLGLPSLLISLNILTTFSSFTASASLQLQKRKLVEELETPTSKRVREKGLLIEEQSEYNKQLCKAAQIGNKEEVERLLQAGAYKDVIDSNSFTPLHYAARNGHREVIETLLMAGAHKNARNKSGHTPLHLATQYIHKEVVEILMKANVDSSVQDENLQTPLHIATQENCNEIEPIVGLLLEGTNYKEQIDKYGNTPLSYTLDKTFHMIGPQAFPRITRMLLLSGNGELTFAQRSEDLLRQWGFNQDTFKYTFTTSSKLLEQNSTALCSFALENKELPTVLVTLIRKYYESLDIRLLLFTHVELLNESLLQAAQNGNSKEVDRLLQAGAYKNARGKDGKTPLHWAAEKGHRAVVETLLRTVGANKAMVDKAGYTPLHIAAENGHRTIVKILLEAGAYHNAQNTRNWTPLHCAVEKGHEAIVKMLLDFNADTTVINILGYNPLHLAAENGHEVIVKLLLKAGADKNAVIKGGLSAGTTSLHLAAEKGHVAIVKILLDARVDKNAVIKGGLSVSTTSLHLAAKKGHVEIVKMLLDAGADKTAVNIWGQTPLHLAGMGGHGTIVEMLSRTSVNKNT